jgi:hypothetical protein
MSELSPVSSQVAASTHSAELPVYNETDSLLGPPPAFNASEKPTGQPIYLQTQAYGAQPQFSPVQLIIVQRQPKQTSTDFLGLCAMSTCMGLLLPILPAFLIGCFSARSRTPISAGVAAAFLLRALALHNESMMCRHVLPIMTDKCRVTSAATLYSLVGAAFFALAAARFRQSDLEALKVQEREENYLPVYQSQSSSQ